MGLATSISVYLIIWWVVLFCVLPIGVTSHAEAGTPVPGGGDPASPVDPKLKRKFITTTWISGLIFAALWTSIHFHWLTYASIGAQP